MRSAPAGRIWEASRSIPRTLPPECTHAGALRAGAAPAGVFSLDELAALAHSTLTVSADCISDFAGAPDADITPLGMPHVHPALQPHPRTGEECLYLPLNPEGLYDARSRLHWATNASVWSRLEESGFAYDHAWCEGDLPLWDNLQVLHRAGGGSGDRPRLLLRTQTMYS